MVARAQFRLGLRALLDHAAIRLVRGELDRLVEKRLVGDDAPGLEAAGGGEDQLRLGIVDAGGKLMRREAAEDDGMDRADARAGEHADHRFRDHRHIENDAVALADTEIGEHRAKGRNLVLQLRVAQDRLGAGDGAVMDDGRLRAAARLHMAVDGIPAGVAFGTRRTSGRGRRPCRRPCPTA